MRERGRRRRRESEVQESKKCVCEGGGGANSHEDLFGNPIFPCTLLITTTVPPPCSTMEGSRPDGEEGVIKARSGRQ